MTIEWARSAVDPGFRDLEQINASATIGERFVVVGQRNVVGADGGSHAYPGIWFSDDGIRWHPADLEEGDREDSEVHDVAVGGAGLVAVGTGNAGAAVWLSTDGERWTRVHDDAFAPGRMWKVAATAGGIVAFGDDCLCFYGQGLRAFWTSPDGLDWQRETSGPGLDVANGVGPLVVAEGELTAFVRDAESADAATRPIEVWRTGGQLDWAKVGELPESRGVNLWQAAPGPHGWVATGSTEVGPPSSWTSPDGVAWTVAPTTPGVVHALLADQAGFIAVGSRSTSTGCSEPPGAFIGKTWASSDGLVWREVGSEKAWTANAIMRLLQRGRTVIGVGLSYATDTSGHVEGAIWTTTLPHASVDAGPTPTPTPRPSPGKGCGG